MKAIATLTASAIAACLVLPLTSGADPSAAAVPFAEAWNPSTFAIQLPGARRVDNSGSGVRFAAGETGTFTVKGDVRPADGTCSPGFSYLHLDTDDNSATTGVTATLYRMESSPFGSCSTSVVASVSSSDSSGCHTDNTYVGGHSFDFCNYVYWVELTASRSTPGTNVNAYRVSLHL